MFLLVRYYVETAKRIVEIRSLPIVVYHSSFLRAKHR